jgi:phenylacetate-CoA ligase
MYREFYDSNGFQPVQVQSYEDIENVPIITRDIMQSYLISKRIDSRVFEKDVIKDTTSGSTGEPLETWISRTESFIQILKVIRYLKEWGYSPFYYTIRLWGNSKPQKSIVQKFGLFGRKDIEILGQANRAVDEVLKSRCDVLWAIRSSIEAFADEVEKRKIEIRPRIIVSTGEMLNEEHRDRFRNIFGCNTLNTYGSQEIGSIAWECPKQYHNLHIDMETVLINYRDIVSQPTGKIGSLIVTNLESFVMPFIRYDLGDQILLPENDKCPCGATLPLLGQVFGRNDDILDFRGQKYYFNFFYNIFQKINSPYIKKYKVVQTKKGIIEFRILLFQDNEETRTKCIFDLESAFKNYFSPVTIRFVDDFPLQPNRKFKVLEKEK